MAAAIRSHHEWFDGSGYPDGLAGQDIPLFGRLLAISDVFDSLIEDRPYRRRSYTPHQALDLIESESGSHFDPDLVPRFLAQAAKDL
jgi:putative two-component system response regulator